MILAINKSNATAASTSTDQLCVEDLTFCQASLAFSFTSSIVLETFPLTLSAASAQRNTSERIQALRSSGDPSLTMCCQADWVHLLKGS